MKLLKGGFEKDLLFLFQLKLYGAMKQLSEIELVEFGKRYVID